MSNNAIIRLEKITKFYGDFQALQETNTEIMRGEFFSLLGPSGCGKTTLLRTIAGFEHPSNGVVYIEDKPMTDVPANKRPTNMVFQSYAIFPHMSVEENVAYGLKARKLPKAQIAELVAEAIEMVGLKGFGKRASHALSGGQRQRVALARALVLKPKVLLLDEPLSALDKKMREQMQTELRRLQRAVGITFILVTHDQEEALTMSDRIAVMFDGEIAQIDTPQGLYKRPNSRRVAEFIGVMNFMSCEVVAHNTASLDVKVAGLGAVTVPKDQAPAGIVEGMKAAIRPEMLTILDTNEKSEFETAAKIDEVSYYGDMTYYEVRFDGHDENVTISMRNTAGRETLSTGDTARIGWGVESILLLP